MNASVLGWASIALFGGAFVLFFGRYLRSVVGFVAGTLSVRLMGLLLGWPLSEGHVLALALPIGALAGYYAAARRSERANELLGAAAGGVGAMAVAALLWGHLGPSDRVAASIICLVGLLCGGMVIRRLGASGEVILVALLGATGILLGVALMQSVTPAVATACLFILIGLGTGIQTQQLLGEEAAFTPQTQPTTERTSYAADPLPYPGEWAGHYDHGGVAAGH